MNDTNWRVWFRDCILERIRPYYLRFFYFRLFPSAKPESFDRCWGAASEVMTPPGTMPATLRQPKPELPDLLFLPMTDWHERIQRTQQLALALSAAGYRCFTLNPHLGRQFPRSPFSHRPSRLANLAAGVTEIHVALPREPVYHHRLLAPAESEHLSREIGDVLRFANTSRLAVISSLPTWSGCVDRLRSQFPSLSVYDCHDWLAGLPNMSRAIVESEEKVMASADLVLFSSQRLQSEFRRRVPATDSTGVLLRNGVPAWPPHDAPRALEWVAVYVGAIEEWLDAGTLELAARTMHNVRFRLAGRASSSIRRRFRHLRNVELLGEVAHRDLPGVLASARVGLIPFHQTQLIHFTDPIKIYEYFHFGLPVVTTCDPDSAPHDGLVYYADSPQAFQRQLLCALSEQDAPLELVRKRHAAVSTWETRAAQLASLIAGHKFSQSR